MNYKCARGVHIPAALPTWEALVTCSANTHNKECFEGASLNAIFLLFAVPQKTSNFNRSFKGFKRAPHTNNGAPTHEPMSPFPQSSPPLPTRPLAVSDLRGSAIELNLHAKLCMLYLKAKSYPKSLYYSLSPLCIFVYLYICT